MMIPFLSLKQVTDLHGSEIAEAVNRVVGSGWYLQGKELESFECNYASYIGAKYCIGCANGLDALILMLRGYMEMGKLHEGDEVIVPANTFIATILAITENNLKPVLVDPDIRTYQIDETKVVQAITSRTRAVMLVHLYGRCAMTERIAELCKSHNLLLFEDNAQAHGCKYKGTRTGVLGNAAAHSFYPGKNLGALGDGGAITTDDEQLASVVRALSNYGSHKKYVFRYQGRNSRLDEIQAAVLNVKLKYLDSDNQHRKDIAEYYIDNITNPLIITPQVTDPQAHVFHLFPVLCQRRDELQQYLAERGIQTQIHYPIPPHKQECYKEWNNLSFPITEQISAQELSLPISPAMTLGEAKEVVYAINEFK